MKTKTVDVVVVGGGCAGLVAALTAKIHGADVLLVEKTEALGGTLAWSGGAIWAPLNDHELAAGIEDNTEKVTRYMSSESGDRQPALIDAFVEAAPQLIRFLEQHTSLVFELGTLPDYQAEAEGAVGNGFIDGCRDTRSLGPLPINIASLGEHQPLLRRSPIGSIPMGFQQLVAQACPGQFHHLPWEGELGQRINDGWLGGGEALAAGLIAALLEQQVSIQCNSPVKELVMDTEKVTGVILEHQDNGEKTLTTVLARHGVILCTGGFEWNERLRDSFLAQPIRYPASPCANEGDGLLMAMKASAALDNMSDNWGWLAYVVPAYLHPAERTETPVFNVLGCLAERAQPHSIIVNRLGQRFANEAAPYSELCRVLSWKDDRGKLLNLPAYHIFDRQYRDSYCYGPLFPNHPLPDWIVTADTLVELANKLGIPADIFEHTVNDFNAFASRSKDPAFGRGDCNYDHVYGDRERRGSATLGPLSQGPFYAVEIHPSSLGTKGGALKGTHAEVIGLDGEAIAGLYAAGNVAASLSGPAYFGPGATLAEAMVFAWLAARHATHHSGSPDHSSSLESDAPKSYASKNYTSKN